MSYRMRNIRKTSYPLRVSKNLVAEIQKIKAAFKKQGITISDAQATEYYANLNLEGGSTSDCKLLKDYEVVLKRR